MAPVMAVPAAVPTIMFSSASARNTGSASCMFARARAARSPDDRQRPHVVAVSQVLDEFALGPVGGRLAEAAGQQGL